MSDEESKKLILEKRMDIETELHYWIDDLEQIRKRFEIDIPETTNNKELRKIMLYSKHLSDLCYQEIKRRKETLRTKC